MVKATWNAAGLLLLLLAAPACFDVATVDPGAVVIDDFDDGDFVPMMSELRHWQCYAFNPSSNRDYRCDHTSGHLSPYSLFVEFSLQDPPDGVQQYGGAGVGTIPASVPIDMTPYGELIMSAKLQSGSPSIPSEARLYVELYCGTVESESGALVSNFYVVQGVKPSEQWTTFRLGAANWAPPPWQREHIKGGSRPAWARLTRYRSL